MAYISGDWRPQHIKGGAIPQPQVLPCHLKVIGEFQLNPPVCVVEKGCGLWATCYMHPKVIVALEPGILLGAERDSGLSEVSLRLVLFNL